MSGNLYEMCSDQLTHPFCLTVLALIMKKRRRRRKDEDVKFFSSLGSSLEIPDIGDGQMDPSEIVICKNVDGSDWVLGAGTFGQVCERVPIHNLFKLAHTPLSHIYTSWIESEKIL